MLILVLIFFLNGILFGKICAEDDPNMITQLSRTVLPQKYALSIIIDLDAVVFSGNVTIALKVLESQKSFTLHSKDLNVDWYIQLKDGNEREYKVESFDFNDYQETVRLNFTDVLEPGDYTMSIAFSGVIRSDLKGLYRSSYQNNGETV